MKCPMCSNEMKENKCTKCGAVVVSRRKVIDKLVKEIKEEKLNESN